MLYEVITENNALEASLGTLGFFLRVESHAGPITVIRGDVDDRAIGTAAALCARYSDAKLLSEVTVSVITSYSIHYTKLYEVSPSSPATATQA